MAGKVRRLIDELLEIRARGNAGVEHFLRAHLALNGLDPERHTHRCPDDPEKIRKLEQMIEDFRDSERLSR